MRKYAVCLSGGVSSAMCAVETFRHVEKEFGTKEAKERVILLNHRISQEVEDKSIQKFKEDISSYLDIPITYANMDQWETMTPLRVCKSIGAFHYGAPGNTLCTYKLKTEPFHKWLKKYYPVKKGEVSKELTVVYGFDKTSHEIARIQRRTGIMLSMGYQTDYPLAFWPRTIKSMDEIGISIPNTYKVFKHANCRMCLKAGIQHFYTIYCLYPELFKEAMQTEEELGFSIKNGVFLEELVPKFEQMKKKGILPTDRGSAHAFWANERHTLVGQCSIMDMLPCECSI